METVKAKELMKDFSMDKRREACLVITKVNLMGLMKVVKKVKTREFQILKEKSSVGLLANHSDKDLVDMMANHWDKDLVDMMAYRLDES